MDNIQMNSLKNTLLIVFCLTIFSTEIYAAPPTKLFVFGDSYVDAGNWFRPSPSWLPPYGITFPGKPSGRFSDGKVLSDFIAEYLGIEAPIAYKLRQSENPQSGMNFAYGGTGVFPTIVGQQTLGQQIELFTQLINQNVYTKDEIADSIALVSVAGNDYGLSVAGGSPINPGFTVKLINQLSTELQKLQDLGLRKVAVTALEASGCLPASTSMIGYMRCNDFVNMFAQNHNRLLTQMVQKLNGGGDYFFIVDLYNGFLDALKAQSRPGILKPCCGALSGGAMCTLADLCPTPGESFFWDILHPAQHGWQSVYEALIPTLGPLKE